jgi:ferredoxin
VISTAISLHGVTLIIDPDRCEGHGRCYSLYPELFYADDDGRGHIQPELDAEVLAGAAREAMLNCPERAIQQLGDSR